MFKRASLTTRSNHVFSKQDLLSVFFLSPTPIPNQIAVINTKSRVARIDFLPQMFVRSSYSMSTKPSKGSGSMDQTTSWSKLKTKLGQVVLENAIQQKSKIYLQNLILPALHLDGWPSFIKKNLLKRIVAR